MYVYIYIYSIYDIHILCQLWVAHDPLLLRLRRNPSSHSKNLTEKKVIEQWRFPDMGVTPPFSSICLWDIPWSTSYWGNPMAGWS